jgi:probable F420-dependent oxidoreductase
VNGPSVVEWRKAIGRVGVWVSSRAIDKDPGRFATLVEQLGFGALWVGGSNVDDKAFDLLARALEATEHLVVATGITNIWAWRPDALAHRVASLDNAHRGRFLLGLGVSHAPQVEQLGRHYERPHAAMSGFLTALDQVLSGQGDVFSGQGDSPTRPARVLAALGPRMLELARDRSEGAHPYLAPPEHTELARGVLGDGPLLAPEQAFVLNNVPAEARAVARGYLERYLQLPNYLRNLERLGYRDEDFLGGGSDRLVDALVAHGDAEVVAERARAHLEAGADHVCVQPLSTAGAIDLGVLEAVAGLVSTI